MVPYINHAEPAWVARSVGFGCLALAIFAVGFLPWAHTPAWAETVTDADRTETSEVTNSDNPGGTGADPTRDEILHEGQQVYARTCSSCHQPGGAGLVGQFPPLLNNPTVDDTSYLEDVIENGLVGELVVDGETYDGVMPSFSTLSAAEVEAVVAYMQAGFVVPAAEGGTEQIDAAVGAEERSSIGRWVIVALLVVVGIGVVVLSPRLLTENDRLATPWLDAGAKAVAIVVAVALLIVVIPNWALTRGRVTSLSRPAQDLIGTGVWGGGLALLLYGLWLAHRRLRV